MMPDKIDTSEKITFTYFTGIFIKSEVPKKAPKKAAMIIQGIHCQQMEVSAPTVMAPTAFQMVATKIIVCMMAFLSSKPNTPTRAKVANKPAPEDKDPENIPIKNRQRQPRTTLNLERFSISLLPKLFFKKV